MSEDDRAAKAARAKALLAKKRQQKKTAETASNGPALSSVAPSPVVPARTLSPDTSGSPHGSNTNGGDNRDVSSLFGQDNGSSPWSASLPLASSPPPRVTSAPPRAQSKPIPTATSPKLPPAEKAFSPSPSANEPGLQEKVLSLTSANSNLQADVNRLQDLLTASQKTEVLLQEERGRVEVLRREYAELEAEKDRQLHGERKTIEFLVSEKASLTTELQKREDFETKWRGAEEELEQERDKSQNLEAQLHNVQIEFGESTQRITEYQVKEKELLERSRELERQLQRVTTSANESRKEAEETGRRLQELTEQVQNDDRVERLEKSLKHSQDRADELEFQLSKLKQVHASLKAEKEASESRVGDFSKHEAEWKAKVSDLETRVSDLQTQIDHTSSERDSAVESTTKLRTDLEKAQSSISDLQEKLAQAAASVGAQGKQIHALQTELKNANRRADESDKTARNLQQEGSNLMRSLEEMRPKIVELTDTKLHLAEQVDTLQRGVKNRDTVIEQLETSVEELKAEQTESQKKWQESISHKDRDVSSAQTEFAELQKGYNHLQEELATALASIRSLEAQRASSHQEASRRLDEIDRLNSSTQDQSEELLNLRDELDARRRAQDEEQEILERAQNELETLRAELSAKDEELDHLREVVLSPTADAPRSLDEELLSSIRQQHALEISAAHSQIRALENSVFEEQAKAHESLKQVSTLQEQVTRLQGVSRLPSRTFSPIPSRPSSRAKDHDLRRASSGTHRPNPPSALARTVFDQALSPETLHKRKVSLSMLKARIESEVAVAVVSQPPSRALSPVYSLSGKEEHHHTHVHAHPSHQVTHRPQFLDESHVFWCSSCQGDLVIL